MHYRNPDIYRDMYIRPYVNYVAAWHAYPNEYMGHYCQRFRDAMLPYIPLDMDRPMMQALHILRDGLPPEVRQFTPPLMIEMTLDEMIDAIMGAEIIAYMVQATPETQVLEYEDDHLLIPVNDATIAEPIFHGGPFMPKEPIPALRIQGIPSKEEDAYVDDIEMDSADHLANPEENPEDLLVIIIASDDEEEIREGQKEQKEDPEEILFNDDDEWDVFSDVTME